MMERFQAMLTRAKFGQAKIAGGRTLVQVSALDNETYADIELLLPPGYVAMPRAGSMTADPLLLEMSGFGSHKVAICGDDTADAVEDLAPGERGLSNGANRVILRVNAVQLVGALMTWAATADGTALRLVQEAFMPLFNAHTHNGGSPPDQQMNATHLTGGT